MNLNKQEGLFFPSPVFGHNLFLFFLLSETQSSWINPKDSQNFPNKFQVHGLFEVVIFTYISCSDISTKRQRHRFEISLWGQGFCTIFHAQWNRSAWALQWHHMMPSQLDKLFWDPWLGLPVQSQSFLGSEATLSCWPQKGFNSVKGQSLCLYTVFGSIILYSFPLCNILSSVHRLDCNLWICSH